MSRIVRNTSAVAAAFATNTILSFLQIKLLTRYLTQSALGEYSATSAIGAIVSVVAALGLPTVILRYTAKYDALGAGARIRRLLMLAWGLTLGLSALLLLVVARVAPVVLPRLYAAEPPAAVNVVLATAVFVAMALRQITYSAFDGLRRMSYPAALENLNVGAVTVGVVLCREQLTVPLLLGMSLARASPCSCWRPRSSGAGCRRRRKTGGSRRRPRRPRRSRRCRRSSPTSRPSGGAPP